MPTPHAAPTVSPFELLAVIWRRKLIVVVVLILSIGAAVVLSVREQKQYAASSQLLFRDPGFTAALFGGSNLFEPGVDPKRDLQTNVNVVSSRNVALQAQKELRTNESVSSLLSSISVQPSTDSNVVTIKATRTSPTSAAAVANAFADSYITYRRSTDRAAVVNAENLVQQSLQTTTDPAERTRLTASLRQLKELEALQTGNAEVIARAQPSGHAVSPRPKRNVILAGLLGLLLGSALALLAEFVDRRVKSVEDFERAYRGYTVIATVPRSARPPQETLELGGPVGEGYRMLREGLRFLDPDGLARCFVIASAMESEGKSTVAVNLCKSLAAIGQRTILIEADMRRPTAAEMLGISPETVGLSNLLVTHGSLDSYLVDPYGDGSVQVLPAGTLPPNPADLLRSRRMPDVLAAAREAADIVVIDPPPLLPVADTRVILQFDEIDGVIVVGRVGVTRRDLAQESQRVLDQSGRRVFGVVIVGSPIKTRSSYYDTPTPTLIPTRTPAADAAEHQSNGGGDRRRSRLGQTRR
ncbi:MAG TPA: polysaccharide biosynthesis tyrosine autokinase [Thermoleophilaceae bacterium]